MQDISVDWSVHSLPFTKTEMTLPSHLEEQLSLQVISRYHRS